MVENISQEFESYLKSKGIHHELTVPHSFEQNGVAEWMNRTLMESALSVMAHAGLPEKFWAEAVESAAYIRNRMPTTAINGNKVPLEVWSGKKADVSHLKVFGYIAYTHVPDALRNKLDNKAVKFQFVGYSTQSKGYRVLDEKTSQVYTRWDVIFNKKDFGHENKRASESPETVEVNPRSTVEPEEESRPPDVQERRPERTRRPPIWFGIDEYPDAAVPSNVPKHMVYSAYQIPEPVTMDEALDSDLSTEWRQAVDSEYDSLLHNNTWDLIELPSNWKAIKSKWVFKIKYGKNGEVDRFKARLVAKGCAQKYGIKTFSPVARLQSIRILFAFAIQNDLVLHQMDVVTAFLNGTLEEEIYVQQPDGYTQPGKSILRAS